ncbi:MAG: UDP-forming cellulose synthase catalytic subunit, partial [Salipiger marinus]
MLLMLVWLALLVPVLFLAATPTATIVQGLLALTVLAILFALKPFVQKSLRVRFFVLAAASTLVLRYWFWRLTETLPSPDDPVSFIAALVLFGAE